MKQLWVDDTTYEVLSKLSTFERRDILRRSITELDIYKKFTKVVRDELRKPVNSSEGSREWKVRRVEPFKQTEEHVENIPNDFLH